MYRVKQRKVERHALKRNRALCSVQGCGNARNSFNILDIITRPFFFFKLFGTLARESHRLLCAQSKLREGNAYELLPTPPLLFRVKNEINAAGEEHTRARAYARLKKQRGVRRKKGKQKKGRKHQKSVEPSAMKLT